MNAVLQVKREAYLDLPNDGRRRWIVDGQVRDLGFENAESEQVGMTVRNRLHSYVMVNLATELNVWLRCLTDPRGWIVCGEAGVRLPGMDTTVGVDIAYIPADVVARQDDSTTLIAGLPQLIVEILSPSDTIDLIEEMLALYLRAGVPRVWLVYPRRQELVSYAPNEPGRFYTAGDTLTDDLFPGLSIPLGRVFR